MRCACADRMPRLEDVFATYATQLSDRPEEQAQLRAQRTASLPTLSASAAYLHAELPGTGIGGSSSGSGQPDGREHTGSGEDLYAGGSGCHYFIPS